MALTVTTSGTGRVSAGSAVLKGSLDDLGGADSVEVFFEWDIAGSTDFLNATPSQTLTSTGSFSERAQGIEPGAEHEFRAVAVADDGTTDTGSVLSFTSGSLTTTVPIGAGDGSGGGAVGVFPSDLSPTVVSKITPRGVGFETFACVFDGIYLYIGDYGDVDGDGTKDFLLSVYDLSDPSNPTNVFEKETGVVYKDFAIQGDYLYGGGGGGSQKCDIFNISDPTAPSQVNSFDAESDVNAVAVSDDDSHIYLGNTQSEFIAVWDVTDKTSPSRAVDLLFDHENNYRLGAVTVFNDVLYVAPDSSGNTESSDQFRAFDVSTPSDPVPLGAASPSKPLNRALEPQMDYVNGYLVIGDKRFPNSTTPEVNRFYVIDVDLQTLGEAATASGGGSNFSKIAEETITATDGSTSATALSVAPAEADDPFFAIVNPVNPSNVPDFTQWYEGDPSALPSDSVVWGARYTFSGEYDVVIGNNSGVDLDVRVSVHQSTV